MNSYSFGRAEHSTEIMGILDSVENHDEWRLVPPIGTVQNFFGAAVGLCRDKGDDPLMFAAGDEAVKSSRRLHMDGNALGFGLLNDFCILPVGPLNEETLKGPGTST